jgi:hypothetical protein
MPTTFEKADADIVNLFAKVVAQWHSDLHDVKVNVGIVLAYNPDGPAVKHGGYPALASIKPCSAKDRVTKGYDAELTIDADGYRDLSEAQRLALLDHEASHITLVPRKLKKGEEDDGQKWAFDNNGRPKLKSVKGDWNVGDGFEHVVARHGLNAIEYRNIDLAKKLADKAREQGEADRKQSA